MVTFLIVSVGVSLVFIITGAAASTLNITSVMIGACIALIIVAKELSSTDPSECAAHEKQTDAINIILFIFCEKRQGMKANKDE